jgi:hypothetical protein
MSESTWGEMAGALGNALGGVILFLEAAVLFPGLLPVVALAAVVLVPFALLGLVLAIVVGVPVAAVRLGVRAVRGARTSGR